MNRIERFVILRTIDFLWKDHLTMMDELREAVKLRAYGQKDPLTEYKREGHSAFRELMVVIETEIIERILKVNTVKQKPTTSRIIIRRNVDVNEKNPQEKNIGRNDPCYCGSGKKFKRCHGKT